MLMSVTKIQIKNSKASNSIKERIVLIMSVLYFAVTILMYALNSAIAAGSVSSNDAEAKATHSKEYYKAVKLIKANNFKDAIILLETLVNENPEDADIHNYLGFSFRKTGNLNKSSHHYQKALNINPKHLGALEYQGELFITLGQIDEAKVNLDRIDAICFTQCKELRELRKAINIALGK